MISPESFVIYFLMMGFTGTYLSGYIVHKGNKPWYATMIFMFGLVLVIGLLVYIAGMPIPPAPGIWVFIVFMPWILTVKIAAQISDQRLIKKAKDVEAKSYRSCVAKRNEA